MQRTQSKFQWQQTGSEQWTRSFDPIEKTLNFMSLANPTLMQFVISLGVVLPEKTVAIEMIQDAWRAMRYNHPVVGCTVTATSLQYEVPTEIGIKEWLRETVHVDASGKTGQELALEAVAPKNSNAAELFFLPNSHEIFILARHEVVDGIGSLILLNNFLELLRKTLQTEMSFFKFGDEISRLPTTITQIRHAEEPSADSVAEAQLIAKKYMSERAIGMPTKPLDLTKMPELRRLEHAFSEPETLAILKACKERNITITHASTAAAAQALLEYSGQEFGPFCTVCNVNLRDILDAPYNNPEHGIGNLFTTAFPVIPISKTSSLLELAGEVKEVYNWWKYKKDNVACGGSMPKIVEDSITAAALNNIEIPAAMVPISLGIVEKYLKEPIEDFWFNLGMSVGVSCLYVYTAKNRLRFVYCYCSAFHERESIRRYNEMTLKHLYRGLGME